MKCLVILFFVFTANIYPQVASLGSGNTPNANYTPNIKYYHAGEIGNRYGKHFEISFILNGNAVISFYEKDYVVTYSGDRPELVMIDNYTWFNNSYSYVPSPRNWVSTHRYNFEYPSIDDVEGNCSVQAQAFVGKFSLYIYNANGFNRVRLFLPFKLIK